MQPTVQPYGHVCLTTSLYALHAYLRALYNSGKAAPTYPTRLEGARAGRPAKSVYATYRPLHHRKKRHVCPTTAHDTKQRRSCLHPLVHRTVPYCTSIYLPAEAPRHRGQVGGRAPLTARHMRHANSAAPPAAQQRRHVRVNPPHWHLGAGGQTKTPRKADPCDPQRTTALSFLRCPARPRVPHRSPRHPTPPSMSALSQYGTLQHRHPPSSWPRCAGARAGLPSAPAHVTHARLHPPPYGSGNQIRHLPLHEPAQGPGQAAPQELVQQRQTQLLPPPSPAPPRPEPAVQGPDQDAPQSQQTMRPTTYNCTAMSPLYGKATCAPQQPMKLNRGLPASAPLVHCTAPYSTTASTLPRAGAGARTARPAGSAARPARWAAPRAAAPAAPAPRPPCGAAGPPGPHVPGPRPWWCSACTPGARECICTHYSLIYF